MAPRTMCPGVRDVEQGGSVVRCGISGMVQPLDPSPCSGEYTACSVWRSEKQHLWAGKRPTRARRMVRTDGTLEWERV